jgi:hypothetical protein
MLAYTCNDHRMSTLVFQFFSEDGAVASILNLLSIYLDKDLQMLGSTESHAELNSDAGSNGSVEDVLVKVRQSPVLLQTVVKHLLGSCQCFTVTYRCV